MTPTGKEPQLNEKYDIIGLWLEKYDILSHGESFDPREAGSVRSENGVRGDTDRAGAAPAGFVAGEPREDRIGARLRGSPQRCRCVNAERFKARWRTAGQSVPATASAQPHTPPRHSDSTAPSDGAVVAALARGHIEHAAQRDPGSSGPNDADHPNSVSSTPRLQRPCEPRSANVEEAARVLLTRTDAAGPRLLLRRAGGVGYRCARAAGQRRRRRRVVRSRFRASGWRRLRCSCRSTGCRR